MANFVLPVAVHGFCCWQDDELMRADLLEDPTEMSHRLLTPVWQQILQHYSHHSDPQLAQQAAAGLAE